MLINQLGKEWCGEQQNGEGSGDSRNFVVRLRGP